MSSRVRGIFAAVGFLPRIVILALLALYRRVVSPALGPRCRFYPTCSSYAEGAVKVHGVAKGLVLAVWRLLRCHPWSVGGYEPAPARGTWGYRERRYDNVIHDSGTKAA
ncbi:MAG: membrane protein insertion efficiency factor YidD [Actinomycetota bacterium]